MERIFAHLYRLGAPNRRGISYTYLLARKQGNLLVSHQAQPTKEDVVEIEELGGIDAQWVCHHHDVMRDGAHEKLHARFGCALYHHSIDRKGVRSKTKCPEVQFDDSGLAYGADFEAFYLPSCTAGHSIFRWRHRGKYYLFTSHAFYMDGDGEWDLQFNPRSTDLWSPQLKRLAKLQIDYVFPGYASPDEEGFYRLNDKTKKSLAKALREKMSPN